MMQPPSIQTAIAKPHRKSLMHALAAMICMSASAEVPQSAAILEEGVLPLPRWSEQELQAFREILPVANRSGALLPDAGGHVTDINELLRTPVPSGPRLDHLFTDQDAELSPRLRSEDMRLFLPESILGLPTQSQASGMTSPTPLSSLQDVPPEFLATCARSLSKEYLIDPDLLVPEMAQHDMMHFLEFHARDARIKLFVLIIAHDRKLPEDVELEKIASGTLLQTDACLLVYPLSEPWRARMFVSKSVYDQTSTEFLSETAHACLHEAMQSSDAHDQLQRYAVHLSTRLFWLQKALGTDPMTAAAQEQTLTEVAHTAAAKNVSSSTNSLSIVIWSSATLLLLGLAGLTGYRIQCLWRLRQQNRVWILPEPEIIPRLGGAFTGGGGGMIRYS